MIMLLFSVSLVVVLLLTFQCNNIEAFSVETNNIILSNQQQQYQQKTIDKKFLYDTTTSKSITRRKETVTTTTLHATVQSNNNDNNNTNPNKNVMDGLFILSTLVALSLLLFATPIPIMGVAVANAVSGGGLDYANIDISGQDFSNGNYKGKDFTQGMYSLIYFILCVVCFRILVSSSFSIIFLYEYSIFHFSGISLIFFTDQKFFFSLFNIRFLFIFLLVVAGFLLWLHILSNC
jgi:hypothetical protein